MYRFLAGWFGGCVALATMSVQIDGTKIGTHAGTSLESLPGVPTENLMLVLLDDVGSEYLEWTDEGADAGAPANTPTMSALADEGISYEEFWAAPACSPTRAALLTGRFGHRTGVSANVNPTFSLSESEATIADRLTSRGYSTGLFGKWHLGFTKNQPCNMGFSYWDGCQDNLSPGNYFSWKRTKDTPTTSPVTMNEQTYATRVNTNAAINWIEAQTGPWFAAIHYHTAHAPAHNPPGMGPFATKKEQYRAMIEYVDGEIARLIAAVDLNETTIWLISDNGASDEFVSPPNAAGKAKYTAYRGGIETACVIAGAAVRSAIANGHNIPGQVMRGHANAVDFYRTTLMLMPGNDPRGWPLTDSQRLFLPVAGWIEGSREWNFTEYAEPIGVPPGGPYTGLSRAVEEDGYKAIWTLNGAQLYDVTADPWEATDLLLDGTSPQEQTVLASLTAHLVEIGL